MGGGQIRNFVIKWSVKRKNTVSIVVPQIFFFFFLVLFCHKLGIRLHDSFPPISLSEDSC